MKFDYHSTFVETLRRPVFCHRYMELMKHLELQLQLQISQLETMCSIFVVLSCHNLLELLGNLGSIITVNIEVEGESEAAGEIATVTPGLHLFFDTVCDGQVVHLLERDHGISILRRCSKPVCCVKVLNVDGVTGSFYFKYVNRTR
ncbi:hypothetical protein QVD17_15537 [Tagetes erecta]|uniref:Uncharacterized protein n=1 Tax=Tagetes erecta TaxID=13708 RepID=A0AAD8NZM3_TARER|nr:hypothetical protein QVD17_15537 [Tagetes erecta]